MTLLDTTFRAVVVAGFVATAPLAASAQDLANYPDRPITFIAMASAGSGFDQLTRAVATTLDRENLIDVGMPVINMQSGSVGAQTVATRHVNDPYMMSFNSLSGMMRYATGQTQYTHEDFTPIARLASDFYTVAVRADSPYQTLEEVLDALRADPLAFPISGGQSDDRIFYGLLFSAAGIDPAKVNYIAFNGGAEASALVLEGSAGVQISTVSEIGGLLGSGDLRGLAFSGTERFEGELSYMPTLQEAGVDLEWQNFRYAMGGPDMPQDVVAFWQDVYVQMVTTDTWAEVLEQNHWGDTFMIEGLDTYLDETQARVTEVAQMLGMAQ